LFGTWLPSLLLVISLRFWLGDAHRMGVTRSKAPDRIRWDDHSGLHATVLRAAGGLFLRTVFGRQSGDSGLNAGGEHRNSGVSCYNAASHVGRHSCMCILREGSGLPSVIPRRREVEGPGRGLGAPE